MDFTSSKYYTQSSAYFERISFSTPKISYERRSLTNRCYSDSKSDIQQEKGRRGEMDDSDVYVVDVSKSMTSVLQLWVS